MPLNNIKIICMYMTDVALSLDHVSEMNALVNMCAEKPC